MTEQRWRTASRPWVTGITEYGRRPPREDRELTRVDATIPPDIAGMQPALRAETAAKLQRATVEIARLDAATTIEVGALSGFLLRSESQSSSKIERLYASQDDFARAMAGLAAGEEARQMAQAASATEQLIAAAGERPLSPLDVLDAHRRLFEGSFFERHELGRWRTVQNWIGGSNFSPRGADYVPPPPEHVAPLMDDLLAFIGRDDLHPIALAAIAHAQFESIHPLTDGNGRIGRAIINAAFRGRQITRIAVVPAASVMLADTDTYFAELSAYRTGDVDGLVAYVADAAATAAIEATTSIGELERLPARWRDLARPRKGSADAAMLSILLAHPVLNVESAIALTGSSRSSVFDAVGRLTEAGVLVELSGRRWGRVFAAADVLDEVDRLEERIGRRVRGR